MLRSCPTQALPMCVRADCFAGTAAEWGHEPAVWSPKSRQLLSGMHGSLSPTKYWQQQQHALLPNRPATASAALHTCSPIKGWEALRQQSHVLLADNEQLQRNSLLLQKQKEQLQAKVSEGATAVAWCNSSTMHRLYQHDA